MAHAYAITPAKPAFGHFAKKYNHSDIIQNKRANYIYKDCKNSNIIKSQSELISIRKITSNNCSDGCEQLPFNKSNLNINLITELYLQNILVLEKKTNPGVPSKIDPTLLPVYAYYNIDPNHKLTGDTPCGIQKYVNYMILDTNAFIESGCDNDIVIPDCFCLP
jgi:hypothetical protein